MTTLRFATFLLTSLVISILVFLYCMWQIALYIILQGYVTDTAMYICIYLLGFISPFLLYLKVVYTELPQNYVLNTSMSRALEALR